MDLTAQFLDALCRSAQQIAHPIPTVFRGARFVAAVPLQRSAAVASAPHGEDVLRAADRAMYEAKSCGHNAYRIAGSW